MTPEEVAERLALFTPKRWLAGKYYNYSVARDDPKNLYFDTRCYADKDIKEFFEDLRWADPDVYERVVRKLPKSLQNTAKPVKRYMEARKEQEEFLKNYEG
jgi:hypothetical protein